MKRNGAPFLWNGCAVLAEFADGDNNRRKQVDVLLNDMEEKELIVMEATAQGLKKARETAE